eukprot:maker-scaffold_40-snap-gene-0.7-mRNA-1 protein AED:0.01 eAED:0.01 QI:198/1/1/1/1/1/2/128/340
MVALYFECADDETTALCNATCSFFPEEIEPEERDENVLLAFVLVAAAGLSTTFGSALVLCNYVKMENKLLLGAALGFSAGVMIYVSFVEIFQKSVEDFSACECLWKTIEEDGEEDAANAATVMATICFFSGVALTYGLDLLVYLLFDGNEKVLDEVQMELVKQISRMSVEHVQTVPKAYGHDEVISTGHKLHRMGIKTALAIGLHNFPEGLATFVATLADPSVGGALAVAIAIHNIPEGLCVAIPVFYATGSRFKGFLLSFFSGFTELLGAIMGYLFLRTVLGHAAYGTLFGIVAGMMVTIVLKELIPTAHRYDPEDKYVSKAVFVGCFVMALSLILFIL